MKNSIPIICIVVLILFITISIARVDEEQTRWTNEKIKVADEITKYQYPKAITLLEGFLNSVESEDIKKEVTGCIEDLKGEQQFFTNMVNDLTAGQSPKKITIASRQIKITKADEIGFEGTIVGLGSSVYTRKWVDIPPQAVFDLFTQDPPKIDRFYLATFCYNHNLADEGEQILIFCLSAYPDKKLLIDRFLGRYKNVPIPQGGFAGYQGQIVTAEEKSYLEKGYIRYQDKWMLYDEMMTAKGLVKFQDKWMTPEQKTQIEERQKYLASLQKLLAPKGILNKPGADKEKLPWDKARLKETDHYVVKANLSQDALDDLCYLMECYYFEARKIFKVAKEPGDKLKVFVSKNGQEYYANGGPGGSKGVYMTRGKDKRLMAFYLTDAEFNTTTVLLHEGTHQFVDLICNAQVPIWINEGLATYYESSKFEGIALKTNLVNRGRLKNIRDLIREKKVRRLADFINIQQSNFQVNEYAHAWSLVYFFMNYNSGQYADELETYFQKIGQKGVKDNLQHKQLFEDIMKVKTEVLEKQWEEYIIRQVK